MTAIADLAAAALACAATLGGFALARRVSSGFGHPPWLNPVLWTAVTIAAVLPRLGLSVARYEILVTPIRLMLAPAIVALATALADNRAALRAHAWPIAVAVTGGCVTGVASALGTARLLGLSPLLVQALATKSVSSPFVVAIDQATGGPVALAAAFAVLTGVIGALLLPRLFDLAGVSANARGTGTGVAAHLVGSDALARRDPAAGALAAAATVLAGLLMALALPLLWSRIVP